jgi:hypothetical protein
MEVPKRGDGKRNVDKVGTFPYSSNLRRVYYHNIKFPPKGIALSESGMIIEQMLQ